MVRFCCSIEQRNQIYSCEANGLGVVWLVSRSQTTILPPFFIMTSLVGKIGSGELPQHKLYFSTEFRGIVYHWLIARWHGKTYFSPQTVHIQYLSRREYLFSWLLYNTKRGCLCSIGFSCVQLSLTRQILQTYIIWISRKCPSNKLEILCAGTTRAVVIH